MEETLGAPPAAAKVSAVIVSHNSAPALRRSLAALERTRDRQALEIVVVDAGSRDDCPRMDAEFPRVTVMRLARHFGLAKALNIGIRTAQGEYLLLLDPNVEVAPDTVPALAARLDADSDAVAVCPLIVDPEGRPASVIHALPTPADLSCGAILSPDLDQEAVSVPLADWGAVMARKFFIRGLNYFDERFGHHWLDAELCYQIRRAGKKTLLLPRVKVVRWPPEDSFPLAADARAALDADRALGAATFARKHFGLATGIKVRIWIALAAIGRALRALVTFGEIGFEFARMTAIIGGQKIDGSQRAP
jgi:hypothetical protein